MTSIVIAYMVRSLVLLCIFLTYVFSNSCEPVGGCDGNCIDHGSLFGDWKWVMQTDASVINGAPYDTLTPASTGITRMLSFRMDSTYLMKTGGTGIQQSEGGNFKMKQELIPGGPIILLDFVHNGLDSTVNHILSNDSLYISSPHISGKYTVNIYTRIIPM
jgi:hypothetical protein